MNELSMFGDLVVASLLGVQPEILSLFAAALLVLAVTARKPIGVRAQKRRRNRWRK
jgi:hypothetical protein